MSYRTTYEFKSRKLRNFKRTPDKLGIKGEYPADHAKGNF